MAPRIDRGNSRRHAPRAARPLYVSSNVQPRMVQSSRRLARIGTITQLEGLARSTSPRSRRSPTSRGNIHLLGATGREEQRGELGRLRSVIRRLEAGRHASINRFIPPEQDAAEVLELPEIDSDSSPEEVENMMAHMIDYFLQWTDETLIEGPSTIFQDIRLIHASLQSVMELPEEVISSPVVHSVLKTFRKRYETFVSIWAQAIHRALVDKLLQIESQLKHHPAAVTESVFTSILLDVRTASSSYALLVLLESDQDSIPLLLSSGAATELSDRCARLHGVFQNATYNSEQKELWLLIWRGLKTVFTSFDQGAVPTSPTNIERDRIFFELPGVYREFKRLISSPDAANPRSIEDMVGKYCRYIFQCQVDPSNKYESLQRPRDAPLESHTKEALREFIETGKFETSTLSKIHFAASRFNTISGGPVKVRRWQYDVDDGEWETDELDVLSPVSMHTAEGLPDHSTVPLSARSSSSVAGLDDAESFAGAAQKQSKGLFPYPEGINMKSAFDYVYYPFPETRAHEIVQHEQISREMGQPGIVSDGPRADFLVNRPPPHARDPADVSVSNRLSSPFEWIRSAIGQLLAQRRRVSDVNRPKVNTLPSRPSKRLALKPRPRPIDPKARVRKSTSVASPSLKLRGGGPPPQRLAPELHRKRSTFDPLAYRRLAIEIFRRRLNGIYGADIHPDEDEMLRLLKQTTYDVGKAVKLYSVVSDRIVSPAGDTADEQHRRVRFSHQPESRTGQRPRLLDQNSMDHNTEVYAYRMDTLAESGAGLFDYPPGSGYDGINHYYHGAGQPPTRPVLGELPTAADPDDDNPGEDSPRPSSDRENHRPRSSQLSRPPHSSPAPEPCSSRCHPCPRFAGQYHHVCRHAHVVEPRTPPPFNIHEDEASDGGPNQNPSLQANQAVVHAMTQAVVQALTQTVNEIVTQVVDQVMNQVVAQDGEQDDKQGDEQGEEGSEEVSEEVSEEASEEESEKGSQEENETENEENEEQAASQDAGHTPHIRRPPREEPRDDDNRDIAKVFQTDPGYKGELSDLGIDGFLHQAVTAMYAQKPNWINNESVRRDVYMIMDGLADRIMELRDQYLVLLEPGPPPFMETVSRNDTRHPNPDHPATVMLCRRAARDVRQHYGRLYQFFDDRHLRTNLGFRHQFNRLIVAVRELRHLFLEYAQVHETEDAPGRQQQYDHGSGAADQTGNQEEDTDDSQSDSQNTPSTLDTARLARRRTSPRRHRIVPTRQEYELMFVDELERELRNRGFTNLEQALGKKRWLKADLVNKLMALDQEGNHLGHGADEGYRHITGNLTARSRPKGFNLDHALQIYNLTKRARRGQEKQKRKEARRQARIARGIHSPAPVLPRVQPNPVPLAVPRPVVRASSPDVVGQDSEDSDTVSVDFRRP
ncbi:hypothetical protein AYO21_08600 [Fonsecaea monophora]|uniref:Uncharacterized protein n=1 Tax=Fonsecaea monophora TaxID=254056 RepID=A0A177F1J4_9EURO|nr:hypothetical protein AYO21_08600 [Fonsecaea monophora]KAH0836198.1 hypothetical protein FOPE_04176 [Fonsecaea pedrosoi]OAG37182.1 hypothetical protein AYO21_08600 [Fonsecaea monophora]